MPEEWFREYKKDHNEDRFAHGAAFEHQLTEMDRRVTRLERWRTFVAGGMAVLAFQVTVVGALFGTGLLRIGS